MSGEQAFKSLSLDFSEMIKARASKTILRICCKLSLVYLETKSVVAKMIARGGLKNPADWSDSLSYNSKGEKELRRAMETYSL